MLLNIFKKLKLEKHFLSNIKHALQLCFGGIEDVPLP